MKRCCTCRCEKEESEFGRNRGERDGLSRRCKICTNSKARKWVRENPEARKKADRKWRQKNPKGARRAQYKYSYGVDLDWYDQTFLYQGGVCAICGQPGSRQNLCIDHDHTTGEVRGLLCARCNTSLGLLSDRADLTAKATVYLLRFSTVPDSDWEL